MGRIGVAHSYVADFGSRLVLADIERAQKSKLAIFGPVMSYSQSCTLGVSEP